MIIKTYKELSRLNSFEERFDYLRLNGSVGNTTFGFDRYLNQKFYKSPEWIRARHEVIFRDNGCDLGIEGHEIYDKILIHHMNPISIDDVINSNPNIFNPDYLICVSHRTHNAIHFGDASLLPKLPVERRPNDMCPWKD